MSNARIGLEAFKVRSLARAASGLALPDLGEIFTGLLQQLIETATGFDNTGPDKKTWVLEQVATMFDQLAPSIPLPVWLAPFRGFIMPALKKLVLSIASGALEAIYARFFK